MTTGRRDAGLHAQTGRARRADRALRRRRAQRLPDQALPALGPRVPALDDRQHADDRLHRPRRRRQPRGAQRARDEAARRRRHLGVPRDHLRDRHRDGRLGALGGDDRVHVHGAGLAAGPPDRHGRLRGHLRHGARVARLRGRRRVHRDSPAEPELRRGRRAARDRVDLVHRRRDDDRRPAARLAGEGHAARVRRAGSDARRLGRLLPGVGAAGVDAVDLEDLAGDLRAPRRPQLDSRRGRPRLGRRLAAAPDRGRLDPARPRRSSRRASGTRRSTGS